MQQRSHIHVWVGSRTILGIDTCIYQTIRAVLKCWYIYRKHFVDVVRKCDVFDFNTSKTLEPIKNESHYAHSNG